MGHRKDSNVGHILNLIRQTYGTRFSVRFSNALDEVFSANSTEVAEEESGKSGVSVQNKLARLSRAPLARSVGLHRPAKFYS